MGKREISHYEQFLLFQQCFQKIFPAEGKTTACSGKGHEFDTMRLCFLSLAIFPGKPSPSGSHDVLPREQVQLQFWDLSLKLFQNGE